VDDARTLDTLADEIVDKQLSVRALEARVHKLGRTARVKTRRHHPHAIFIKAAAEELTQAWRTRVEIKPRGKGGSLQIHYGSEAELDRIFEGLKKGPGTR
jgi:ParB family chromosome partitioning protein